MKQKKRFNPAPGKLYYILFLSAFMLMKGVFVQAQEVILTEEADSALIIQQLPPVEIDSLTEDGDTILLYEQALPDSIVREAILVADSVFITPKSGKKGRSMNTPSEFKPNSTRAVLYSAAFPGLGQIYNRKYWKLPIIYGGYMAFMYAITWNNQMYQDYYHAYMDIMDDALNRPEADPSQWSDSWKVFISNGQYENYINNTTFQGQLKRRKDYYRRYRDLSIILTVGFYALCMIDAYVDAELFDFDISPDLSMRIEPLILPRTSVNQWSFGLSYCITF